MIKKDSISDKKRNLYLFRILKKISFQSKKQLKSLEHAKRT